MPYTDIVDVEDWGQFTSDDITAKSDRSNYESFVQKLIKAIDGEIEAYCRVKEDFFQDGGITMPDELHSGKYLPSGNKPLLQPKYTPLIEVHKLEYYDNGAWGTKTEGHANDYIVAEEGVYLVTLPNRTEYSNIRINYQCGYALTPRIVWSLSTRMTAEMARQIMDVKDNRVSVSFGGVSVGEAKINRLVDEVFTQPMKEKLREYRMNQMKVYRG